jgi:lysophospholipase L1-like esterase
MRLALCLAVTAAGLGLTVAAAGATASAAHAGGGKYVAMGSSYSAGPGIAPNSGSCGRSGRNYANLVAQARGLTLVDVACDGATTANISTTPQRLRDGRSTPLQIDAVTSDTTLVTITVGGNDLGYIRSMINASLCSTAVRAGSGRSCRPVVEPAQADYDKITAALRRIVVDVRARAPEAQVVLVDYLPVLDAGGSTCAVLPLTAQQQVPLEHIYSGVVAATAEAAAGTGALLARASAAGATHTACSATPWVTGLQRPVPFHPNAAGMAGVAALVESTLDGGTPT